MENNLNINEIDTAIEQIKGQLAGVELQSLAEEDKQQVRQICSEKLQQLDEQRRNLLADIKVTDAVEITGRPGTTAVISSNH